MTQDFWAFSEALVENLSLYLPLSSQRQTIFSEVATAIFSPLGAQVMAAIFCMPSWAGIRFCAYLSFIFQILIKKSFILNKMMKVSTIVSKLDTPPLEVTPPFAHFKEVILGQSYEMTVTVRNNSFHTRRIRVQQPRLPQFSIITQNKYSIAAGLTIHINIILDAHQLPYSGLKDCLMIRTQGFQLQYPIQATLIEPLLSFQTFLEFGYVKIGCQKQLSFKIKNVGNYFGRVSLSFSQSSKQFKLNAKNFQLQKKQQQEVLVIFKSNQLGLIKNKIEVRLNDILLEDQISLSAISVEFSKFFVDQNNNQISEVRFDDMLFGQEKSINIFMVNNTPRSLNFKINFREGFKLSQKVICTPEIMGQQQQKRVVSCQPTQGVITYYGIQKLTIKCLALPEEKDLARVRKYFIGQNQLCQEQVFREHKYFLIASFFGKEQEAIRLQLQAETYLPRLKISPLVLQFGEIDVNLQEKMALTVKNLSFSEPLHIQFRKLISFRVEPQEKLVQPLSSFTFTAIFAPKSIGVFQQNMRFNIQTFFDGTVKMFGLARRLSDKPVRKWGPLTIAPQTQLTRMHNTVSDFHKTKLSDTHAQFSMTRMSISPMNQKFIAAKRKSNKMLQQWRKVRIQEKRKLQLERQESQKGKMILRKLEHEERDNQLIDDSFSLGILNTRFSPPNVILPDQLTKGKFIISQSKKSFSKFTPDINKPSPKIFKSTATSHKEQNQITRNLNPQDLVLIKISPSAIFFGTVFVMSQVTRYVHFFNATSGAILVEFDQTGLDCLLIKDSQQVIPSQQHCSMQIIFRPTAISEFSYFLAYSINRSWQFELDISASVIAVTLQIQPKMLKFNLADASQEFQIKEDIQIRNNGNAVGRFYWEIPFESKFSVQPSQGQIQPSSFSKATVTYNPGEGQMGNSLRTDQTKLVMKVVEGIQSSVKCIGVVQDVKVLLKDTQVNLGVVPIDKQVTFSVILRNYSRFSTVTCVQLPPELQGLLVCPSAKTKIGAEEKKELIFKLRCKQERSIDSLLRINIRGSKKQSVRFRAEVVEPMVFVQETVIDFGQLTTLGNPGFAIATIRNLSMMQVELQLNLGEIGQAQCLSLVRMNVQDQQDSNHRTDQTSRRIVMISHPDKSIRLELMFRPEQNEKYCFPLPLRINGSSEPNQRLGKPILCDAVLPKIIFQPLQINFKKVFNSEQSRNLDSYAEIFNPGEFSIHWQLVRLSNAESPFSLCHSKGQLQPNQKQKIKVTFSPEKVGQFSDEFSLVVQGSNYLKVRMKGVSKKPHISFSQKNLRLPVAPLDTEVYAHLKIENDGYEHFNFFRNRVEQLPWVKIRLYFNINTVANWTSVLVKVTFSASKSTSFTTKVTFFDDPNEQYTVLISGTADNCLLTNYPYFQLRHRGSQFLIKQNEPGSPIRAHSIAVSEPEDLSDRQIPLSTIQKECACITRWLNFFALQNPLNSFPTGVIELNGQPIYTLLTYLTNNKHYWPDKSVQMGSIQAYRQLINKLRIQGALLNHICAQHLLSYDRFSKIQSQRPFFMQNFIRKSIQAWTTIFYQVVRIHYLGRFNIKANKFNLSQSIVQRAQRQANSNIYGQAEVMLFAWFHQSTELQIYQFDDPYLATSLLEAMLYKYCQQILPARVGDRQDEDYHEQSKRVIGYLFNIGLQFYLQIEDLLTLNSRSLLLYYTCLASSIINYSPKNFKVKLELGEEVTQIIKLNNPTNKEFDYWVRCQSSPLFSINCQEEVKLEANGSYNFPVKIRLRFYSNFKTKLFFIQKRACSTKVMPLVFIIVGQVTGKRPLKIIEQTADLYKATSFTIKVQNPFEDKQLVEPTISLVQSSQDDYNLFFCNNQRIKLRGNKHSNIDIRFFPILWLPQLCRIEFVDKDAGEFVYQLLVKVNKPTPIYEFQLGNLFFNFQNESDINLSNKNPEMLQIRKVIQQSYKSKRKVNVRIPQSDLFEIQTTPPDLIRDKQLNFQIDRPVIKLVIKSSNKNPEFQGELLLFNKRKTDVRRYRLKANFVGKPIRAQVRINGPIGSTIVQKITLTGKDERGNFVFTVRQCSSNIKFGAEINNEVNLKKQQVFDIPVTFTPKTLGKEVAVLIANDRINLERIQFQILAVAEEPLCQRHFILQCNQNILQANVFLPSLAKTPVNYLVETGLGRTDRMIRMPPEGFNLNIKFQKLTLGCYKGFIKLIEEEKRYRWFTFALKVLNPQEQTILIEAGVGSTVVKEIRLKNIKESMTFSVVRGGSFISGPQVYKHTQDSVYILTFTPKKQFSGTGWLKFVSNFRQIKFDLQLKGVSLQPVRIPMRNVPLGNTQIITIPLTNNFEFTQIYKASNKNVSCFSVSPNIFSIQPGESLEVKVEYTPFQLGQLDKDQVRFATDLLTLVYNISCVGIEPQIQPTTTVEIMINQTKNFQIVIKNVLKATFQCFLEVIPESEQLVLFDKELVVKPGAISTVSLAFKPKSIMEYNFTLVCRTEKFSLQYPIKGLVVGVAECMQSKDLVVSAVCRKAQIIQTRVKLRGGRPGQFIINVPSQLKSSLEVSYLQSFQSEHQVFRIRLMIIYQPFKPLKRRLANIYIERKEGGRWLLPMFLEALMMPPDDSILIEASVGNKNSVKFRLTNRIKTAAAFRAYYSENSSSQLDVSPKEGVLQPYGKEGTQFVISYSPKEFRLSQGLLVIQTADMMWTFQVRGQFPKVGKKK